MSYSATRRKRFTAGVLAGAMAFTVMPILGLTGTAGALEEATGEGSVCEDAPESTDFTDVGEDDPSAEEIECLVGTEITQGVTATTYEPNASVTRRQMALFLVRLGDTAEANEIGDEINALPAGDGDTPFTDIADETAEVQAAIDRLSEADVAQGVTATEFVPHANVTRRQMAKFLVRIQEYLAGEDITPDDPEDAFPDDEGDTGEAELNILAAEGVFEGDADGDVNPGDDITRRQMANVLVRKLQYFFENGVITRLFAEDSNQTFAIDGAEAAVNEVGEARQYTVTNPSEGATHTIALFPADSVTMSDGIVSFADGGDGSADNYGDTTAEITVVNGTAVAADQQVVTADPVGGVISFTVNSDDAVSVVPVVFADSAPLNVLSLDEDNQPTEPFGIGGVKTWLPNELGQFDGTAGDVIQVNQDDGWYTVDEDADGIADVLVRFAGGENFGYTSGPHDLTISQAQFSAWVSGVIVDQSGVIPGDSIDVTNYNPGAGTTHVITNDIPNAPTDAAAVLDEDAGASESGAVNVTWTPPTNPDRAGAAVARVEVLDASDPANPVVGDPQLICLILNDPAYDECNDYFNVADYEPANNNALALAVPLGYDAPTPPEADTLYAYIVVAINASLQNGPIAEPATVEIPAGVAPTVTSAALTADTVVLGAVDSGDVWTLEFSADLDAINDGDQIHVRDEDGSGDLIRVECDPATDGVGADNVSADCVLTGDTLVITLTDTPGDIDVAGDGDFVYPVTIVASAGITAGGSALGLAGSADLVIG